jgi:hypothetical protein
VCGSGLCSVPTCSDGARNGSESGTDCGGACAPCGAGIACNQDEDCGSGVCALGTCSAPTCSDGVHNGTEADVDCGGICAGCANGKACSADADCASANCQAQRCAADTTPPSTPTLNLTRHATARSKAILTWTMPGDDGSAGSVTGYELRIRSCAIGAQCVISDADFASATLVAGLPPVQPGGTSMQATIDDVPVVSHVELAMRFVDEAGNSALSTASLDSTVSTLSIGGDAGEVDYGFSMTSGHFSGSTHTDLVIGRPRQNNLGGGLRVVA